MNEMDKLRKAQYLAYQLFVVNHDGVEFMALMREIALKTKVNINAHAELAARHGQIEIWNHIERLAQNFVDHVESENQQERK